MFRNRRYQYVGLILLWATFFTPSLLAITLYVSLRGDDNWSGKLTKPNPEQTDGPSAKIGHLLNRDFRLIINRGFI